MNTKRIPRALGRLLLLLSLGAVLGCAPGLGGSYSASGAFLEEGEFGRFSGQLEIGKDGQGVAHLDFTGRPPVRVALCDPGVDEENVRFVLDAGRPPSTSCSAVVRPLEFQGRRGRDLLSGSLHDAAGRPIGLWRALRVRDGGGSARGAR